MKSVYNRPRVSTDIEIYSLVMKMKGEIDTIRENKDLDDKHDLSLASNYLDSFLNALDEQGVYNGRN